MRRETALVGCYRVIENKLRARVSNSRWLPKVHQVRHRVVSISRQIVQVRIQHDIVQQAELSSPRRIVWKSSVWFSRRIVQERIQIEGQEDRILRLTCASVL